ncbi:sugar phosphate isomerase/epimerase [Succinatimonas hippei]|uniref:sugar phosphate isomerase/epimerase family protein n=1 Tax=Succinatimonas hippei TaxID=626938 RepID=UPI0026EDFE1D|nr:sugar phosphate isomerase/epimerase family protein [Succinatimonas hippei]
MRDLVSKPQLISINSATINHCVKPSCLIEECSKLHIGAIGPWVHEFPDRKSIADTVQALNKTGLKISCLSRSGYMSAEGNESKKNLENNFRYLDIAAELSAPCFGLVVGGLCLPNKDLNYTKNIIKNNIHILLEKAKKFNVSLALEPLHPMTCANRSVLCSIKESIDWCQEIDPNYEYGLGIIVDVYHTWWDPELFLQIKRAKNRILGFHVSDWNFNTVDTVYGRVLPGDGVIDIPKIRAAVEDTGFKGFIELELLNKQLVSSIEIQNYLPYLLQKVSSNC